LNDVPSAYGVRLLQVTIAGRQVSRQAGRQPGRQQQAKPAAAPGAIRNVNDSSAFRIVFVV
jgi:hypothetical protein